MPPLVVELELWSQPRSAGTPYDGKAIAERCRSETGLGSTVVLGLNFVPDAIDVENLRASLSAGELTREDFLEFCAGRRLEPDVRNERSASEFLAFANGQALAWLHLPAEETGLEMARTLVAWASRNTMQLRDGASTYEPLSKCHVFALWQRGDA
jgi:hypothetical protein